VETFFYNISSCESSSVCTGVNRLYCLFSCRRKSCQGQRYFSNIISVEMENFRTVLVVFFCKKKNFEIKNLDIFKNDFQKCLNSEIDLIRKAMICVGTIYSFCFMCSKLSNLHEFYAGSQRVFVAEEQQKVFIHRQEFCQLKYMFHRRQFKNLWRAKFPCSRIPRQLCAFV